MYRHPFFPILLTFLVFNTISQNICCQTWSYDFGTATGSFYHTSAPSGYSDTSLLPSLTSGERRIVIGNGQSGEFVLANPGLSTLGSNSELRFRASASAVKSNSFKIYDYLSNVNTTFHLSFKILLGDANGSNTASDGDIFLFIGNGSTFSNASDGIPGNNVTFSAIKWHFDTAGVINSYYLNNSTWASLPINTFTQGQEYHAELIGNNSTSTISYYYTGTSNTVAVNKWDLWINGVLICNDIGKGKIGNNTAMDDFGFWGMNANTTTSNSQRAHIFLDDLYYSNSFLPKINQPITNWTGDSSTTWFNHANWSDGVPGINGHAIIPNGCTNYPYIQPNIEIFQLSVNSGAMTTISSLGVIKVRDSLTMQGTFIIESDTLGTGALIDNAKNDISGSFQTKKYYTSGGFHFISSPVNNGMNSTMSGSSAFYSYSEPDTAWNRDEGWISESTSSGNMTNGKAYAVLFNANSTKTFTGLPNTDSIAIGISNTYPESPVVRTGGYNNGDGWNLIGNPFPSPISVTEFISYAANSSIDGTVYLWDDDGSRGSGYDRTTDYAYWNMLGGVCASGGGDGYVPDGNIAVGQGFYVKKTNPGNSTIHFTNEMRTTNTNCPFFIPEIQATKIKLSFTNSISFYNELLIGFHPSATLDYDRLYDATKLIGNKNIAFYSLSGETPFAIQTFPPINSDRITIPLGYQSAQAGKQTIKLEFSLNLNSEYQIYLHDAFTSTMVELTKEKLYNFHSEKGVFNQRLELIVKRISTSIDENAIKNTKPSVIMRDYSIHILENDRNYKYKLINMAGQSIQSGICSSRIDIGRKSHQMLILHLYTDQLNYVYKLY